MPRTPRLIINGEAGVYHVMSRTALDGFPLGDIEKDFMVLNATLNCQQLSDYSDQV